MKKIVCLSILALFIFPLTLFAGPYDSELTAKQDTVNRQTPFNNLTDSLATVGKSKKEKSVIRRQRREKRRLERLQNLSSQKSQNVRKLEKDRKDIHRELERRSEQNNL